MPDYSLNLAHNYTAHSIIINLVGNSKSILEVGCASGYLSNIFTNAGCKVTAIEIDKTRAEKAKPFCQRVVIGSIEDEQTLRAAKGQYDVILFADILEHLRYPEKVLIHLKSYLKENGYIIVSLPNVSNWKIRMNLIRGKLSYTEEGILDRTHLRFFTLETARKMLEECGFHIEKFLPGATRMPRFLVQLWPTLFAVHLIFKARKS
jgi:2-polyprenyl-3-methyl-5-hydroxy-6-metoxy-1,4-benzoquinol methylase